MYDPTLNTEKLFASLDELMVSEKFAEALQLLEFYRPRLSEPAFLCRLGYLERGMGQFDLAIAHFERGLSMVPDSFLLHYGLGLARLTIGDLARGWEEFEWRLAAGSQLVRDFVEPQWKGKEDLRGKTILLHAEGGFGDAIQFCRYIPTVAQLGPIVFFECQPTLIPLLARLPGIAATFARGNELPRFDLHCPLQSLPLAFQTTLASLPNRVPYLSAPEGRVEYWRQRLGARSRTRIGIAWCGSSGRQSGRSDTIGIFSRLASIPAAEYHSLQVGRAAAEPRPGGLHVIDHAAELVDFGEAAALITQLDLVISVDTSIAHLAGALGRPVWVVIPKDPDFRWLLNRSDSPWYPTMRLFRQNRSEKNWDEVVDRIAGELRHLTG